MPAATGDSARVTEVSAALGIRPLSARSVVASVLMGAGPRGLRVAHVVRIARLFGVAEGTVRVAVSRMAASGEIRTDGGRCRLAGRLADRQRRLVAVRWPQLAPTWDGTWLMRIVTVEGRSHADRQALRRVMTGLRCGEFALGCWIRPDNIVGGLSEADETIAAEQCESFAVAPRRDARELAHRLWDLPAWNGYAARVLAAVESIRHDLSVGDSAALATGLVISAAALRHASHDPLLPTELLPTAWLGRELQQSFADHDVAWQQVLRSWIKSGAAG